MLLLGPLYHLPEPQERQVALCEPRNDVIRTGRYDAHVGFVQGKWHTSIGLSTEVRAVGFEDVAVYGIEGPAWPTLDALGLEAFDDHRGSALRCASPVEADPLMQDASARLLAVARS